MASAKMEGMADSWREFDVAVGRSKLGEVPAEDLPTAAVDALVKGCDTPSLGRLAGMQGAGWSQVEDQLKRVLDERGVSGPDHDAALKCVADHVLRQMVDGEYIPEEATERLMQLSMKAWHRPAQDDLLTFVHLARDWEVADYARLDPTGC